MVVCGWFLFSWGISDVHAQAASESDDSELSIPRPKDGNTTLVVRVEVSQPYIDHVATRVTYDGLDRMFGIQWKNGNMYGHLRVPDALVTEEQVFTDILDDTNAGISLPERYTPLTAPRLLPYLLAVREKWGRQFDDMAYASTGIGVVALVMTMRPATSPLTARAASTPKAAPAASKPKLPRATVATPKSKTSGTVASAESVATPPDVWALPPVKRGRVLEKALGGNLIDNFPVIDKWKNGVATSIKSVDLGAKSYQNTRVLTSTVTRYIKKVAKFRDQKWGILKINESQIKSRVLELAIPHAGTIKQQAALEKLIEYGASLDVEVKIIVFP